MIRFTPFQWTAFNFFGFFCAYGVLMPFLPVWLKHYGYGAEMIGIFASVGYLFRFLGGMLAAQKVKNVNQLIPTARWLSWLNIFALLMMWFTVENSWLLFLFLMLFHIFNAGAMPIGESIASVWQQQQGLDYGKVRLFGSIAFVVGSMSTGYFVGWWGENVIIFILIGFFVLLGLGQSASPTVGFEQSVPNHHSPSHSYKAILKTSSTRRMLIATALITASHAAYYTYSTLYWSELGISTQAISLLWGLGVVAEIGLFFLAKRFFTKIKIRHLIIASTLGTMLRWMILANATEVIPFALSQLLHAFSFALMHFAMMRYISSQETEKIAKLQGLYFGLGSCAVMAVFTFLSGMLYPYSPNVMFMTMALCALPAMFIVPSKLSHKPIA